MTDFTRVGRKKRREENLIQTEDQTTRRLEGVEGRIKKGIHIGIILRMYNLTWNDRWRTFWT